MLVRTTLVLLLAHLAPAQNPLYVDPVHGVDQPGGGSAAAPLKTLTFAVAQSPGQTTFRLRPGTYDQSSGESFPITFTSSCVIEGDPARVPPYSGAVSVVAPMALTTSLAFNLAQTGTVVVRDLSFSGGMFRALQTTVTSLTTVSLVVHRCQISQSRCVVMNVATAALGTLAIVDCELSGPDTPVIVAVGAPDSRATVLIDRSVVRNGLRAGVYLDASLGGSIDAFLRASRVGDASLRGVHAVTDLGGLVTTTIEHCLLHDVGTRSIGANVGAIVDFTGASGLQPQHKILNSILHHNRADAPGGAGPGYTWGTNLVSQANLVGLGGNLAGTATFVDAVRNEFHLTPSSAGIDAGNPADQSGSADLDGDPYLDARPDLGPDEVHFAYVGANRVAPLGAATILRSLVAPNAPFVLLLASDRVAGSFGPGLFHLAGIVVDAGFAGVCDARGAGLVTVVVPNNRSLHLRTLYWQAGTLVSPVFGANARALVLRAQ